MIIRIKRHVIFLKHMMIYDVILYKKNHVSFSQLTEVFQKELESCLSSSTSQNTTSTKAPSSTSQHTTATRAPSSTALKSTKKARVTTKLSTTEAQTLETSGTIIPALENGQKNKPWKNTNSTSFPEQQHTTYGITGNDTQTRYHGNSLYFHYMNVKNESMLATVQNFVAKFHFSQLAE